MNSKTIVSYPIIAAMVAAAKALGEGVQWRASSHDQMRFMSGDFSAGESDAQKIPEIDTTVSNDADVLNKVLADRGFSIKLDPFEDPRDYGVVSILELLLEWLQEGKVTRIGKYPAVLLTDECVNFYSSSGHDYPVVVISTKSGDEVYLSVAGDSFDGSDLGIHIETVFGDLEYLDDYSGLIFPMVDLNEKVDIGWLKEMPAYLGGDLVGRITQALQQTMFAMDEKGVKVKSAVAIGARFLSATITKPTLVIDKPFFVAVKRKDLKLPILSGYIGRDCWKRPVR